MQDKDPVASRKQVDIHSRFDKTRQRVSRKEHARSRRIIFLKEEEEEENGPVGVDDIP